MTDPTLPDPYQYPPVDPYQPVSPYGPTEMYPQPQQPIVVVQQGPPTSGLATASLVTGIVGLVFGWCLCGIPSLVAIITGHLALRDTRTGARGGHGQAVAGLVLGYVLVIPTLVIAGFVFSSMIIGAGTQSH